MHVYLPICST